MSHWGDEKAGWDRDVALSRARARLAMGALLVNVPSNAYSVVMALWQLSLLADIGRGPDVMASLELSDSLTRFGGIAQLGLLVVTAVLYLRWLSLTVTVARSVTPSLPLAPSLPWSSSQAVWGFFTPILNIWRPYEVLRDLYRCLDPEGVPEPAPRHRADGIAGYRHAAMEHAPPPARLSRASIGAWWALYILGGFLSKFSSNLGSKTVEEFKTGLTTRILSDSVEIGAAVLAALVVRAVDSRLAERSRRLHHASDEELSTWFNS